jgi:hypothetical protein
MNNHTSTTTRLQSLLVEFYAAGEHTRSVVKHELLGCYYQLTAQERLTMRSVMQPFILEIEQEMIEKDPLAQQASELLIRLGSARYAS